MANYPQLDNASGVWTLREVNDAVMGGYWRNANSLGLFTGGQTPSATDKIDQITIEELDLLDQIPHYVLISAHKKWGITELLDRVWDKLDLMRIYTKPKGQVPDYENPVILPRNRNKCEHFCNKIHKTFLKNFKYAIVWGSSVKHQPMKVGKEHELHDEDVIQIVKKI